MELSSSPGAAANGAGLSLSRLGFLLCSIRYRDRADGVPLITIEK
jgi:hypothetical protein